MWNAPYVHLPSPSPYGAAKSDLRPTPLPPERLLNKYDDAIDGCKIGEEKLPQTLTYSLL